MQQELHLQDPIDALGQRDLVAVVAVDHQEAVVAVHLALARGQGARKKKAPEGAFL